MTCRRQLVAPTSVAILGPSRGDPRGPFAAAPNPSLRKESGLAFHPGGVIYVADFYNDRIQKFGQTTAVLTTSWGRLKQRYR